MGIIDANLIKEKILSFLNGNGPSLPVHIAKEIGMDMIFTSAFLSELISHQKIKTSNMKVGISPVYFLPGQEKGLEKYSEYIKGKEYEALILLKKKKFLKNFEQETAIQVALKSLKDFAKPFEKNGNLIWRYFLINEKEYSEDEKTETKIKEEKPKEEKKKSPKIKKLKLKKSTKTNDEKFFNKIKNHLLKKGTEISSIISFNKKELILEVKENNQKILIFAHNKKRIDEKDILNAYKISKERELTFSIFSLGENTKKIQNLIEAIKKLNSLEKIE